MALKQYLAHSVHFSGGGGHAHCKLCGSHWSVNTFRLCHQGSRQRLTQFQETGALGRTVSQRDGLMCNRTGQPGWLITCWYLISNLQDKILINEDKNGTENVQCKDGTDALECCSEVA